ncbi:MAG: LamG domain-containing protein [Planctomycetes bacterium]|nr:LamG domain-containing protein [Planctomycetota bacterium]
MGYWPLGEGTGTTTYDRSGNNNNGTLTNGPIWTTGRYGNACSFDGTDDSVIVPDSALWNIATGDFTIELWVKHNNLPDIQQNYISQAISNDYYWFLRKERPADGNIVSFVYKNGDNTAAKRIDVNGSAITDLNWHYVVATKNGTNWYLYLDGVQVGSASGSPLAGDFAHTLEIGRYTDLAPTQVMNGLIDNVRIYNRALTAAEVASRYAAVEPTHSVPGAEQ